MPHGFRLVPGLLVERAVVILIPKEDRFAHDRHDVEAHTGSCVREVRLATEGRRVQIRQQGSSPGRCLSLPIHVGVVSLPFHLIVMKAIHLSDLVVDQLQILAIRTRSREARARIVRRMSSRDLRTLQQQLDFPLELLDHGVGLLPPRIVPRGLGRSERMFGDGKSNGRTEEGRQGNACVLVS